MDRGPPLHGPRPAGQGPPPLDRVRNRRHHPAHRTHRIASKTRSPSGRRYTTPADVTDVPETHLQSTPCEVAHVHLYADRPVSAEWPTVADGRLPAGHGEGM
ncbi:predicted protein [Streptomyces viridosporus ATCC 14672]|uniref:Predicted protein n=1 Tax=Streptomyces viridosporus (strain ATCC 14672 / DSM 40746 / JCM 4963 / KCTC 9882 / NRRL B-12104 / FH 1290) TaxID=566461 RepID=D6A8H4_STRV1|nr:predicted protein [Streptomyces viridosporus ATCC 14672]